MSSNKHQLSLVMPPLELRAALSSQSATLRLIDVRSPESHQSSHIEGAVHFDVATVNVTQPPVVGLLPTLEQFNQAMSDIGLHPEQHAVIYDDTGGPSAARLAWTLKAFGHSTVSLLDGGVQAWRAEGLPLTREQTPLTHSRYQGRLNPEVVADRNYILEHLSDSDTILLDARSPAEYSGEDKRSQRGGHIPGAINLDWAQTKDPDRNMKFRSQKELEDLLARRGVERDREIVCYCQSHQRSAVLCILLESLGFKRVKGYPGAWSDWGNQPNTPIETSSK